MKWRDGTEGGHLTVRDFDNKRYGDQAPHVTAPYALDETFFEWHKKVDEVRKAWLANYKANGNKIDQAAVDTTKFVAKVGATPTIRVTFKNRVSWKANGGTATADNKIALIVGALKAGGKTATTITEVGTSDADRYRVYEFSGFGFLVAPAVGAPAAGDKIKVHLIDPDGVDDKTYKAIKAADEIEITWG